MEEKSLVEEEQAHTREQKQFCNDLLQNIQCHDEKMKKDIFIHFLLNDSIPPNLDELVLIQEIAKDCITPNDLTYDRIIAVHTAFLEYWFSFPQTDSLIHDEMVQEIKMLDKLQKEVFPKKKQWETFSFQRQMVRKLFLWYVEQWYSGLNQEDWESLAQWDDFQLKSIHREALVDEYKRECYQKTALKEMPPERQRSLVPIQTLKRKRSN